MSDSENPAINVNINGTDVPLIAHEVKERKTKTGTKPAYTVLVPQVTNLSAALALVTAMINAAEAAHPGKGGEALAAELYFDRAKDATAASVNPETGDFDRAKYVAELVSTKQNRGDTLKALQERDNELMSESLDYTKILLEVERHFNADPSYVPDFGAINAKLGTKYTELEQLILRVTDIDAQRSDLAARIAKKEQAAEKGKNTRAKKEKKAPAAESTNA
jgi:hypothetical protein